MLTGNSTNSRAKGRSIVICAASLFTVFLLVLPTVGSSAGTSEAPTDSQTYWVEQIADGLKFPSSMAWLPNGDVLITERQGGLRILRNGELDPKPISGTPASFQIGLNGLQDIILDPDYRSNEILYLAISEGTNDQHHAAVYRARYSPAGLVDVKRIFRSKDDIVGFVPSVSRMQFLSDKTLLLAVPEGYYKLMAQQLSSHIGKVVRIHRDGSIPRDNPFLKTPGALPEIWCYGLRTPLGLFRDPSTGAVWEVEPGPQGGDELNLLKPGGNYGWAKASWGFDYKGGLAAPMQSGPGIENPILVWMPSATPSGLTRYRGTVYPMWDGNYFVGHLSGKALERLRIEDNQVVLREKMLMKLEERIRYVTVGPDGHIYVLTDHQNGRVLRLQPGRPGTNQSNRVAHKLEQLWVSQDDEQGLPFGIKRLEPGDPVQGKQAFIERCSACHSVGAVIKGGDIGPDLSGIYQRNAGSQPGYNYSASLEGSSQAWDFISLNFFLTDPGRYVPGTKMAAPPVTDAQVRRQIIGFLKQQTASSN